MPSSNDLGIARVGVGAEGSGVGLAASSPGSLVGDPVVADVTKFTGAVGGKEVGTMLALAPKVESNACGFGLWGVLAIPLLCPLPGGFGLLGGTKILAIDFGRTKGSLRFECVQSPHPRNIGQIPLTLTALNALQ